MILITDVHYFGADSQARGAGGLCSNWLDDTFSTVVWHSTDDVAAYEPGAFYKRELPILLALVAQAPFALTAIVVDGYCTLGPAAKSGLGGHLYNALDQSVPVIGVAKTQFRDQPTDGNVLRGQSQSPLYVTAQGIDLRQACHHVLQMHGEHRIPTLLKQADRLCRDGPT